MKETSIEVASLNVQIKRIAKRRSMLMHVDHDLISVKAPYYASNREIHCFVLNHLDWIEKQKKTLPPPVTFSHGEDFLLLGHERMLNINRGRRGVILTDNDFLLYHPKPTPETIKKQLKSFYQSRADNYIHQRLPSLQETLGQFAKDIHIRSYKARWGSCDRQGNLQFNWKLMMAPPDAIDYVIIHELSHLVHFDHSKAFWQLVNRYCPAYKTHKKWLNAHSYLLHTAFT